MEIINKLNELIKQNKLYYFLVLILTMFIALVAINIFHQKPFFDNINSIIPIAIAGLAIGMCQVMSKFKISIMIQFIVTFLVFFTYFSILMLFDNSYVNYTSFIISGVISMGIALLMLIPIISINKK